MTYRWEDYRAFHLKCYRGPESGPVVLSKNRLSLVSLSSYNIQSISRLAGNDSYQPVYIHLNTRPVWEHDAALTFLLFYEVG